MKIGKNKLKMSDGSIRTFKSQRARDDFEKVAQAVKHSLKPTNRQKSKSKSRGKARGKNK